MITIGEPAGFADLTRKQTILVDVYFGGVRRGEASVIATPYGVTIVDPAAVLDLLPTLADRASVQAVLATPGLATNSDRACSQGADRAICGRLAPEVAGVILDRDRLRLDVFLNPRFLTVQDNIEQKYLPAPAGTLSMINAIGAVLSGRSGASHGRDYYNVWDQLVLTKGTGRIRADLSYADGYGLEAERLGVEVDRPGLRYSAGALWAPGNDLSGRQKVLGLGLETQIDTRLDRDQILGSPIVVYLDQRSRVDVVRDRRVIESAIYEAGNQQIDTSNLPEGSYQIVLRIDEPGRPTREERRFFTKSRQVPSLGRTDFFAFGGTLVTDADPGSLNPSRHPYLQVGAARRLSESWAIDAGVQTTDRNASAEIAATLLTKLVRVRAAVVADLDGRYGGILQIASSGTSRLSFDLDLRHIESHSAGSAVVNPPGESATTSLDPFALPTIAPINTSYTQAVGVVSFGLASIRFLGVISYRDDKSAAASYSIGPSLEWDVLRKGRLALTLRGDMAATERGTSEFAGLSLRLLSGRTSLTALAGARNSTVAGDGLGRGPVSAISGSWGTGLAGGDLAAGAGYEHQPQQYNVVLTSEFRHPLGSLAADFVRSDGAGSAVSQYSLSMQTTLAVGAGALRVAGKTTTDGMIVAQVDGAHDTDRFEVLVNEQVAGMIVGKRPLTLALPTYRAYSVRIRSIGKDLLAYDTSPRSIGLYPGAVTRLAWSASPVTIKFGRLIGRDGLPIAGASIAGKGVWSETDDKGYFQIEVPDNAQLTVTTRDGRSYKVSLPKGTGGGDIAEVGRVICCGAPQIELGALGKSAAAKENAS